MFVVTLSVVTPIAGKKRPLGSVCTGPQRRFLHTTFKGIACSISALRLVVHTRIIGVVTRNVKGPSQAVYRKASLSESNTSEACRSSIM